MEKSMETYAEVDRETLHAMEEIRQEDTNSESTDESLSALDVEEDEGWEDVEPDVEEFVVQSLFDEKTFPDAQSMLQYCLDTFDFDFLNIRKELDLDFLGSIRLVNYIRSEVKRGNNTPDTSSKQLFEAQEYLQPVLEDDALLFSLGDLEDVTASDTDSPDSISRLDVSSTRTLNSIEMKRIVDSLKHQYDRVSAKLTRFTGRIKEHHETHGLLPGRRWSTTNIPLAGDVSEIRNSATHATTRPSVHGASRGTTASRRPFNFTNPDVTFELPGEPNVQSHAEAADDHYFESYAQIEIHELMLKDKIRTETYRDFIFDNQHLFKGKIVLDVGCGSGILSLFCAQAGARMVYAVDRSDVINKARVIVYQNGLSHKIRCIHGRMEDMTATDIPIVDIIISEWMGYALLYEAMFDSVIWARDHFLRPGGLMLPSEATLNIAPIYDPQYRQNKVGFWSNVYGFDMSAFTTHIYEDARVRTIPVSAIVGSICQFLYLDLHRCTKKDLTFHKKFSTYLNQDIPSLDAFAIWFDVRFTKSNAVAEPTTSDRNDSSTLILHTGPHYPTTHWEQTYLMVDPAKRHNVDPDGIPNNSCIAGAVSFAPRADNDRELDIGIHWQALPSEEGTQTWAMR